MKIIYFDINSRLKSDLGPLTAAIGFFDGLHQGHKQLVNKTKKEAKKNMHKSAVITFSPSPASVLANKPEDLLSTVLERGGLVNKAEVDVMIVIKFTKYLSQLKPLEFYEKIIKQLNVKHLIVGEDFKFGYQGSGNVETLKLIKELNLSIVSDYKLEAERVSSTLIKQSLKTGDVISANKMLGYQYELNGFVKHGRKKGRTIGFPTLNLQVDDSKFIPKDGVYIGISEIMGKNYISTINIGHNPTINTVKAKSIESFVHFYNKDTYGQRVKFRLVKFIRDEKKFAGVKELIEQMNNDIDESNKYFDKNKRELYNIEPI